MTRSIHAPHLARPPARCVVIGQPVAHSCSPLIHRLGYEFLGISAHFDYGTQTLSASELAPWLSRVRRSGSASTDAMEHLIRGVSCTMPHKRAVLPLLDQLDPIAREIGAVNTIVNDKGVLTGYNTDWEGALRALWRVMCRRSGNDETRVSFDEPFLKGNRVAILGAGGASRALIYGALLKGAHVKVFNRNLKRALDLKRHFDIDCAGLDALPEVAHYDMIINTTSVGMGTLAQRSLLLEEWLSPNQIIFETIYEPHETLMIKQARACGAEVVLGIDMLLEQAYLQFKLYTGYQAPRIHIDREVRRQLALPLPIHWPEPLICGVVVGDTLEQFLERLEVAQAHLPMVELRVDSIQSLSAETLDEVLITVKSSLSKPAILTCRRQRHLTSHNDSTSSTLLTSIDQVLQQQVLQRGIDLGIGWIDVDVTIYPELNLKLKKTRLILSTHHVTRTPELDELRLTYREMLAHQPAIYKFATLAQTRDDTYRLTHYLTELLTHDLESSSQAPQVIMVAMGERFSLSRVLFPLLGSYLTFAAPQQDQDQTSALGQRSAQDYRDLFKTLGVQRLK